MVAKLPVVLQESGATLRQGQNRMVALEHLQKY
jgi:hypothetical protein